MLVCCQEIFVPSESYVCGKKAIEYGLCPICKKPVLRMFINYKQRKILTFKKYRALQELKKFLKKINSSIFNIKYGYAENENFYYGDYKKTRKKDGKGNPIYLQLRKNFNGKTEILGEVETAYL